MPRKKNQQSPSLARSSDDLTPKEKRAQQRQAKVAAYQAERARQARNRRLGLYGGITGGVVVVCLLATLVIVNNQPSPPVEIAGLEEFDNEATHVQGAVDYPQTPPAGGPHNSAWLNCGIYDQAVQNEYATHSLEHGAVWVTYDPDLPQEDVDALRDQMPDSYAILSPYPDLPSPVVASSWNRQVQLDGADDERLKTFVSEFWQADDVPEPGAACWGAIEGEGLVQ